MSLLTFNYTESEALKKSKTFAKIQNLQNYQLRYGNQLAALENAIFISHDEKRTLRSFYITKQNELQKCIDELILELPVAGSERIIVQTGIFD